MAVAHCDSVTMGGGRDDNKKDGTRLFSMATQQKYLGKGTQIEI